MIALKFLFPPIRRPVLPSGSHWDVPRHVLVIGGGPSARKFYESGQTYGADMVIACNLAAHIPPEPPDIQLAVDRPFWQYNAPRNGSLGVWVQPRDEPWARFREPGPQAFLWRHGDVWTTREDDTQDLCVGGGCGPAAVDLAKLMGAQEVTLLGFDGGEKYDRINACLAKDKYFDCPYRSLFTLTG